MNAGGNSNALILTICGLGVVRNVIDTMVCLECLTKYIIIYEVDRLRFVLPHQLHITLPVLGSDRKF